MNALSLRPTLFFLCIVSSLSTAQARPHQEWVELMRRVVEFTTAANHASSANALTLAPEIPTPEAFLGYELGSKHIRHHELVAYVTKLCDLSPRLHRLALGKTFEGRELLTVAVSKPSAIESSKPSTKSSELASFAEVIGLRKQWIESKPGEVKLNNRVPSVAYFAYGVHGNEASPSNSSVLVLYLLAAAQGDWIEGILDQSMILVDPCLNPDGYDRYVQWLENNQGSIVSSDSSDREHNERSPSSRTNHFGFDLNRDWLPATQPETRSRLKLYYDWLPNLVLDVHEMGASQTLFFQPGIEGRDHPATPPFVRETTRRIAEHFSAMLDDAGERHFTNQRFDDFYPGKGSTFPDLHGGVGILIEQGSSAGLIQTHGEATRTFAETVANPVRLSIAALSSLQREHRTLMEYQRQFYSDNRSGDFKTHAAATPKCFLVRIPSDKRVANEWFMTLSNHKIRMFELSKTEVIDGVTWEANSTWVLPIQQAESRFLHAMITRQKEFAFSKFYDVSAWSVADAFGLDWQGVERSIAFGPEITRNHATLVFKSPKDQELSAANSSNSSAMSVDPQGSISAMALMQALTEAALPVRISSAPITVPTYTETARSFSAGSLFLLKADVASLQKATNRGQGAQEADWALAVETFFQVCGNHDLRPVVLKGGLSSSGIDLGSSDLNRLKLPRVAIVLDDETNTNSAGSLWYVFDQVFCWPILRVDRTQIDAATLRRLDVLVFPDVNRRPPARKENAVVASWMLGGGHVIALEKSVFDIERMLKETEIPVVDDELLRDVPASKAAKFPLLQAAKGELPGVLFRANLVASKLQGSAPDKTSFVYTHQGPFASLNLDATDKAVWKSMARLDNNSWLAGSLKNDDYATLEGNSVIAQGNFGEGKVTLMTFDPTFRGFSWDGVGILKSLLLDD